MMQSMQEEMEFVKSGMKNLQGEMKCLQGRAGRMDNSMRDVKKKQNANHMMLLDMDKRQKYHEVLLKNQILPHLVRLKNIGMVWMGKRMRCCRRFPRTG